MSEENTGFVRVSQAVAAYDRLAVQSDLTVANKAALQAAKKRIIEAGSEFCWVTPENETVLCRLFDKVHPQEDLRWRVNPEGFSHRVACQVVRDENGILFPTALIYVHFSKKPVTKITRILQKLPHEVPHPGAAMPYTVSSNFNGEGTKLITNLRANIFADHPSIKLWTYSPLRVPPQEGKITSLRTYIERLGLPVPKSEEDKRRYALHYLLSRQDIVHGKTHGRLGASVERIWTGNGDSPTDLREAFGVMVSHGYPFSDEELQNNKDRFQDASQPPPMSDDLMRQAAGYNFVRYTAEGWRFANDDKSLPALAA